MNIVDREWTHHPFRYRRITLSNLIKDFKWRRSSEWSLLKHNRDDIVDFCADSVSLSEAIRRACRCKRPNGKHHNHQSKVKPEALRELERRMIKFAHSSWRDSTFDELYKFVDEIKPAGIGPVTTYDVAVRVGAYLKLHPRSVYLHAGALAGYHALQQALQQPLTRDRIIQPFDLPYPLQSLTPDEVEDFLCVYRTVFQEIQR